MSTEQTQTTEKDHEIWLKAPVKADKVDICHQGQT